MEEIQIEPKKNTVVQNRDLLRFFSVESDMTEPSPTHLQQSEEERAEFKNAFYSKEFLLKISQLLLGIICAGLYSEGVKAMATNLVSSQSFPNVVFSSFIIITAVIIMGYLLGHAMPEILIRIFNAIACVLYFTAAAVTLHTWISKTMIEEIRFAMQFLFVTSIVAFFNCGLYATDLALGIRRALSF